MSDGWVALAGSLQPGVTTDLRTYLDGEGGEVEITTTVTVEQQVTVRERLRFGATAMPGKPTADLLAAMPGLRYMRDFGKDGPDADSLPELPAHGAGKMATPASCLIHVSWKDDVEQLAGWLDGLTRPVYLTWWHEPMGDITPAEYRAAGKHMAEIIAGHPNRRLVLGNGPIVTRWWLDQGGGNPADWWYDGATFYGVDCYNDSKVKYRTPAEMFGSAARVARDRGVPWLVPEFGVERTTTDKDGSGRAKALREHAAWLRQQRDCLAVGWWNIGGGIIAGLEPEQSVWRDVLAGPK
ncbi:hypothetical protein ACH4T9_12575 [Micromonospora sp. NPDC020750]|uniref:hypothetical protein n=1 Tax=unclassified Micromonospora TaxID=2617518 RepID=UPI00378FB0C4